MTERRNPILGVLQVAVGRAEGLGQFGGTVQTFLDSLAPLIAFPLAGALVELYGNDWMGAISVVLLTLVGQLAPPVLSHAIAARWGVADRWLHYATAFNWCYWAIPMTGALMTLVLAVAVAGGLPSTMAAKALLGGLGLYSLWLHWFTARHALVLSVARAAGLVLAVNAVTALLVIGPALLG